MNKSHAVLISLAVGAAAIAGTVAATKTAHLGQSTAATTPAPSALISSRAQSLDRMEAALRKAIKQRPPKLPALPKAVAAGGGARSAGAPIAAAPTPASQAQRVVYERPAPIIRVVPRAGEHESENENENEHESEGGSQHEGDEGGDGFDD